MFIDAVRAHRDDVTDQQLKQAMAGFIGQEGTHSREHREYNELMSQNGLPAEPLDRWVWQFLGLIKRYTPKTVPLAGTIALEHYTALMGAALLDNPDVMRNSETAYHNVWLWHALEEVKHKAVAFDVHEACWAGVILRMPSARWPC